MDENSVESEGAFGRLPDDIQVLRRPRRPMQGSVAGTSISSSHGSVAIFGRAIRCTLDEIIQDEVIVRKGNEESEGAFGRVPDDIQVLRLPRRPMQVQGSVAGTSISSSHGSVAVFGRAIRCTLGKIIQDEVIVWKGECGAPGSKLIVTNRSTATQVLQIKFLGAVLALV
jgi:hypothetical protein